MTVSGARQHLDRAGRRRPRRGDRAAAARGSARPAPSSRTRSPTRPTASSRRPTASSPTSCSATSPTPTPDLLDTLFERRRDERIRNATERLAKCRSLKAKVAELARILDDDGYLATWEEIARGLSHRRAQLRDLGGGPALRPGMHERDRLHPHGATRSKRRAGAAHGRRRPPLRVRGAPVTLNP